MLIKHAGLMYWRLPCRPDDGKVNWHPVTRSGMAMGSESSCPIGSPSIRIRWAVICSDRSSKAVRVSLDTLRIARTALPLPICFFPARLPSPGAVEPAALQNRGEESRFQLGREGIGCKVWRHRGVAGGAAEGFEKNRGETEEK